jgi:hypothetical protein
MLDMAPFTCVQGDTNGVVLLLLFRYYCGRSLGRTLFPPGRAQSAGEILLQERPKVARFLPARVAERQTQWTQNPPGATPCEFESRLGHGGSHSADFSRLPPRQNCWPAAASLRVAYEKPGESSAVNPFL